MDAGGEGEGAQQGSGGPRGGGGGRGGQGGSGGGGGSRDVLASPEEAADLVAAIRHQQQADR